MKTTNRYTEFLTATAGEAAVANGKIAADPGNSTGRENTVASGSSAVWNSNVFVNRPTEVWRSTAVWGSLSQNSGEQAATALYGE